MKFVKQKFPMDCFPCTVSMISNIPYMKVKRKCKQVCKSFSISRSRGFNSLSITKLLEQLDLKPYNAPEGTYRHVANCVQGRKGLFVFHYKSGDGHACAWNGFKVYDPSNNVQKSLSFTSYMEKYGSHIKSVQMYGIETPMWLRCLSYANGIRECIAEEFQKDFKTLFYKAKKSYEWIIRATGNYVFKLFGRSVNDGN